MKTVRVAVTGAAGQIGYALLFRIASGEMFGPDTRVSLSLMELETALSALKGVVMELEDCSFPLLDSIQISSVAEEAFADADWAILVGSVPRKAGMERGDLLKINGRIFVGQGQALDRVAKPDCRVLVVGNPCNTNAYITKRCFRRLPPRNVFALMMLDQLRAQAQLAQRAGAAVSGIKNLAVWGNHSATQYPDYFHATINGKPVPEEIRDEAWLQGSFLAAVQQRGAEIIRARGLSSAASAAQAVLETVKGLIAPTAAGEFFSVAGCSDGSYGIPEGLVCGFPVRTRGQGWEIVGGLSHNEFARQKIQASCQELIHERDLVESAM